MSRRSPLRPTDDQALVRAAQQGDVEAFAVLVDQHRPWLVGVCRGHLSTDPHAAEDVAQECLVRLHATLVQCPDRPLSVRPWLSVVARHACIDHHRRQSRQPAPMASVPDTTAPAEDLFDVDPALAKAWGRLTARHREILHHRELIGLSYEDIATLMSTSSAGVESLLVRARGALRREYRRAGGRLLGCGAFLFLERSVRGSEPRPEAVAHVAGCPACAHVLGDIERMAGLLRGVLTHLPALPALPARSTFGALAGRLTDRWAPFAPLTATWSHLAVAAVTVLLGVAPLAHAPTPPPQRPALGAAPAASRLPALSPVAGPAPPSPVVAPVPTGASPLPATPLPPGRTGDLAWLPGTGWGPSRQPRPTARPQASPAPTDWWHPGGWPAPRPWPSPTASPSSSAHGLHPSR